MKEYISYLWEVRKVRLYEFSLHEHHWGCSEHDKISTGTNNEKILADKHPANVVPSSEILLPVDEQSVAPNHIIFDSLNADLILKATLRTKGAAGFPGLHTFAWRRLCSNLLQETFAAPLLQLVVDYVNP